METNPDRLDRRTVAGSSLTPSQRKQRAKLAALTRWGKTEDRAAATEPARNAFLDKFENDTALRAHMTGLSFKASRAS